MVRAGMVLLRELHWSGALLDIIWRPNALVPALEVEFLNSFSLSIGIKDSVHYISKLKWDFGQENSSSFNV